MAEASAAGWLESGRALRLSQTGKDAALQMLGLSEMPAKLTWPQLRDKYLVGIAAGASGRQDLRTKAKLSAFLLGRRFGLNLPEGASVATAAAAIVCKELGFGGLSDLKALQAAVLGRLLEEPANLPPNDAVEQFIRIVFKARRGKIGELREAVIESWVKGENAASPAQEPAAAGAARVEAGGAFDVRTFAAAATRAAAASPTGWFGDNKVFIAHAWRQYQANGESPPLDLPAFKAHLVEANRARSLTLSRADLVAAMDPADVRESQTQYLNAEFHFILIERGAA